MGFLDKLKEQASGVQAQLQDTIRGSNTARQLNTLQGQRKQLSEEMAEAVLDMYRQGGLNQADLETRVQQIFDVERDVLAAQEQMEAERQAAAEAKAAQQQARAEGYVPPAPPAGNVPATRYCGNCGAGIEDPDVKFCPNCGNAL